ncbi:MAG: hypothetical protein QOK36_2334, partial [Gaiellales bacterium]|nr:hypothetical protein [Gaiellales bacterium]
RPLTDGSPAYVLKWRVGGRQVKKTVRGTRQDAEAVPLKAAGLERIRLHDLRHSAATLAVAAGESILFVQAQLGHADVRTTQRYAHPDAAAHRAAAARVATWRIG